MATANSPDSQVQMNVNQDPGKGNPGGSSSTAKPPVDIHAQRQNELKEIVGYSRSEGNSPHPSERSGPGRVQTRGNKYFNKAVFRRDIDRPTIMRKTMILCWFSVVIEAVFWVATLGFAIVESSVALGVLLQFSFVV